ncbi:TIGR00304 family protein [Sulfolobus sp. A20]|uniref:TIGR00304 family membrane protein n=1 Tax=Sulfolobaceae TaxID=118883 RepID=UPI000845EA88|nr:MULTISPECIES: TIGR00304 family protein [unclassified Sulfolobus]TRM76679.1 TIGR00304 family protein [Sulfolobus sp. E5]TRM77909.1 TIGR00304 family protein [Sulfolobus sp. B5]TRM77949.1 TIGR00304 family protein [Sulfolobus sp. A20-N-F8]TRM80562.1 TIGR00304 family protein [Sulfolobus sp. D5]TRM81078.1 TIGR00304 family protein [Sulfolobus sp. A20-N-F6]TRM85124.1 TIGR00304 family protein [Sulfolobus sp. F3]TRM85761.1 TIGR00304 family protein [Sulfolobus sp. E3]TRM87936.1 TIGR00304 family pro
MNEYLFYAGLAIIFISIILLLAGSIYESRKSSNRQENNKQRTEVGGVIFIGPIPIVFGSSKGIAKWMIILAIILFIIMVVFYILY